MNYKVVINHGWSADVFFYSSAEAALNVLEHAKKDGKTAKAFMRYGHGLAWILFAE